MKLKFLLGHTVLPLLLSAALLFIVTHVAYDLTSQLQSGSNGIEILLLDTAVSPGKEETLVKAVKKATGVRYVGTSSLDYADTAKYIADIKNYSMAEYLFQQTDSHDAELLLFPAELRDTVLGMKNLEPLGMDVAFASPEEEAFCSKDGVVYCIPLAEKSVSAYGSHLISVRGDVYGVLLSGADHTEEVRQFLASLH